MLQEVGYNTVRYRTVYLAQSAVLFVSHSSENLLRALTQGRSLGLALYSQEKLQPSNKATVYALTALI